MRDGYFMFWGICWGIGLVWLSVVVLLAAWISSVRRAPRIKQKHEPQDKKRYKGLTKGPVKQKTKAASAAKKK